MHYFVSFLVSCFAIISTRKRESWLLYFNYLSYVLLLLMLCVSTSRCRGGGLRCVTVVVLNHTHLRFDSLFYVPQIVCGVSVLVFVLLYITFCSF